MELINLICPFASEVAKMLNMIKTSVMPSIPPFMPYYLVTFLIFEHQDSYFQLISTFIVSVSLTTANQNSQERLPLDPNLPMNIPSKATCLSCLRWTNPFSYSCSYWTLRQPSGPMNLVSLIQLSIGFKPVQPIAFSLLESNSYIIC